MGELVKAKHIHFIGVSGIGVSAVARLTIIDGVKVTGSALEENSLTSDLVKLGMKFYRGHKRSNVGDAEMVVMSAAVKQNNPEVIESKKRGIPVILYSQYLGLLMGKKEGLAVSGTHGKTTTTSMVTTILKHVGRDPFVVCGGVMKEFFTNALYGSGKLFVAEACEYNRSFHHLKKRYGIITNIEPEHLDYYYGMDEIIESFRKFFSLTQRDGFFVINGDDTNVQKVVGNNRPIPAYTVGETPSNEYRISIEGKRRGCYSFSLVGPMIESLAISLPVPGRFNMINAALAAVTALKLGISEKDVAESLNNYRGTSRRMELIGTVRGNPVVSDYAHHPTEIRETLNALKERYSGRNITVVFQPHQYSRTIHLFNSFVQELKLVPTLVLTEIYGQRDNSESIREISGRDLFNVLNKQGTQDIYYGEDINEVIKILFGMKPKKRVIVFMGAGSVDEFAHIFVRRYGTQDKNKVI